MRRCLGFAGLLLLVACGDGNGNGEPPPPAGPCGQVLGEILVQPLLAVHGLQVQIEVEIVTVDETHLQSLGISWPNFEAIGAGASGATPGDACGPPTATDTSVTGGAENGVVLVPEGTSGMAGLPVVLPAPTTPNDGALTFTNMGGPGTFTIADARRQSILGLSDPPSGEELSPIAATGGISINYLLTNAAGRAQFLTEIGAHAASRIVSSPKVVTIDNQTATIFVGTEVPTVGEITQPYQDAVIDLDSAITFAEVGVTLRVTPSIPQTDIIRLTIEPRATAVVAELTTPFLLDGTTSSVAKVPIVQTRQLVTQVLVPDGATMIVGGVRDDTTMITTPGIPQLAELPVVGTLVRNHNQLDLRDPLLLVVTPRIVAQP